LLRQEVVDRATLAALLVGARASPTASVVPDKAAGPRIAVAS